LPSGSGSGFRYGSGSVSTDLIEVLIEYGSGSETLAITSVFFRRRQEHRAGAGETGSCHLYSLIATVPAQSPLCFLVSTYLLCIVSSSQAVLLIYQYLYSRLPQIYIQPQILYFLTLISYTKEQKGGHTNFVC
jgi:hypothetical protein